MASRQSLAGPGRGLSPTARGFVCMANPSFVAGHCAKAIASFWIGLAGDAIRPPAIRSGLALRASASSCYSTDGKAGARISLHRGQLPERRETISGGEELETANQRRNSQVGNAF